MLTMARRRDSVTAPGLERVMRPASTILLGLVVGMVRRTGPAPATAGAVTVAHTRLHQLAKGVYGLVSDGSRYVLWTAGDSVTVYDANTGGRRHIVMPERPCA